MLTYISNEFPSLGWHVLRGVHREAGKLLEFVEAVVCRKCVLLKCLAVKVEVVTTFYEIADFGYEVYWIRLQVSNSVSARVAPGGCLGTVQN